MAGRQIADRATPFPASPSRPAPIKPDRSPIVPPGSAAGRKKRLEDVAVPSRLAALGSRAANAGGAVRAATPKTAADIAPKDPGSAGIHCDRTGVMRPGQNKRSRGRNGGGGGGGGG